jgi:hypothetical protein
LQQIVSQNTANTTGGLSLIEMQQSLALLQRIIDQQSSINQQQHNSASHENQQSSNGGGGGVIHERTSSLLGQIKTPSNTSSPDSGLGLDIHNDFQQQQISANVQLASYASSCRTSYNALINSVIANKYSAAGLSENSGHCPPFISAGLIFGKNILLCKLYFFLTIPLHCLKIPFVNFFFPQ